MMRKKAGIIFSAIAFLILILDSNAAAQAASDGLQVCIRTVIPCLFPLFLLSGYLTSGLSGGKYLAGLFHCHENSGTILLTGLLGGYPLGARLAADAHRAGAISKEQGDRLLWFCSQAGPSFVFGIAAVQVGGIRDGWMLWGIQILSALTVAWLLPPEAKISPHILQKENRQQSVMTSAINAMASVSGWVIIFSVLIAFCRRWFLWLLPETMQVLLCGLLELTNGFLLLGAVSDHSTRMLLASVMLSFGGLCVLMQTVTLTHGLNMRGYLLGKLLQTGFAVLYALVILGNPLVLLPILCIFSLKFLKNFKNRTCVSGNVGI